MYKLQEQKQLSVQIMHRIMREMKTGIYKDLPRLPPEVSIADSLGVSRTAVRDALAILEREGLVTRKHGLGTIINRHVLEVTTRIDLEKEFLEMIRDAGFTPSVPTLDISEFRADAELAKAMKLEEGDEIICILRVVAADGVPTIFCRDYLAKKQIIKKDYCREDLEHPIFDFLKKFCNTEVYLDLTEMRAVNASKELADSFHLPEGTALLHLNEMGYDVNGQPILKSEEYYRDGILHHTILRIKI